MLLNCFICLHTVSRARKRHSLLCQRWQCQEMWKETCLRRPKPFSRTRFLFDRPEHPPAGSLPPELCWDMLLHHRSFFQSQTCRILPHTSYVLHFPALTISRTCHGSSRKTREVTGLEKEIPFTSGSWAQAWVDAIWDTVSQAGHRITYRSASETPAGLVPMWTGYGAALVCTSVPINVCLKICHTSQWGFTKQNSLSNPLL